MDYRSRQRVPSDQISNSKATLTTNDNSNQHAIATPATNAPNFQTSASSTRTTSSLLGGSGAVDQQLDSLQSSSSSQLAMLSSQQHYQQSNYPNINSQHQQQHQRLLAGGANKMQQRNIMQQQQHQHNQNINQNKQQQQQNRIASNNNQQHRLMAPRTSAAAAVAATSKLNGGGGNQKQQFLGLHNHHYNSSSGDNMTTSSGEQTIDDLQQLAHIYRNPNNPSSQMQQHSGKSLHEQSKLSPMYGLSSNERQIDCLNPLSPRLPVGPSTGSTTTTTSSSLAAHSSAMIAPSRGHASNSSSGSRFLLGVLFTLAEILLFSVLLLWLYWAFQHDDGLSWQNERKQQFNTHAALMILGFIFLNGQAMLIYRSFQCCTKIYTKILHTLLFVLATSAIGFGLCLAYTAQENVGANNKPIMHFYSLHAWNGLASISLFALQFTFGFLTFLVMLCCEQATSKFRAALLPIHKTFGLIIFSLAISTCLTGLLQTARSRLSSKLGKVDYHELGEAGIVINVIGVCLICLAILMPYIIRNLDIKRPRKFHPRTLTHDRQRLRLAEMDMSI